MNQDAPRLTKEEFDLMPVGSTFIDPVYNETYMKIEMILQGTQTLICIQSHVKESVGRSCHFSVLHQPEPVIEKKRMACIDANNYDYFGEAQVDPFPEKGQVVVVPNVRVEVKRSVIYTNSQKEKLPDFAKGTDGILYVGIAKEKPEDYSSTNRTTS